MLKSYDNNLGYRKFTTIMTLLSYSSKYNSYKLDTYQDTCVKQLMVPQTKGRRELLEESLDNNENSVKTNVSGTFSRFYALLYLNKSAKCC